MAESSKISWTDSTWNPWLGCTKVSAGCTHCYAEVSQPIKMRKGGSIQWGAGQPRERTKGWDLPLKLERNAKDEHRVITVFPSLCDVFDVDPAQKETLDQWRDDLFDLIEETPNLVWLLLTKRPEVAATSRWIKRIAACGPNLWIGASVENQTAADARVPQLLKIPTANRFVSAEPLLGPLDLSPWLSEIPWVILGGESGSHARPMDLTWARKVRDDCRDKTLFFFKQVGGTDKAHGGEFLDGEKIQQTPDFAGIVRAVRGQHTVAEVVEEAAPVKVKAARLMTD